MASWPTSVSSNAPTLATASSVTACKGGSRSHSWDTGVVTTAATATSTGVMTYTCAACGQTETRTIPMLVQLDACDHSVEAETTPDEGFTVTFAGDSGVSSIIVYETQDYTGASASVSAVGTTVSRDSASGDPDSTGNGQVNFTIVPADGYTIADITITGSYKNLKGPADTGKANTYRVTKVGSNLTITVTTVACEHGIIADGTSPVWTWSADYKTATLNYTCAACGENIVVAGAVTSVLTDASTITFTAFAIINGVSYTDSRTASPYTATFSGDEGVASVLVYYTQDYTTADEENVSAAVARDGDSGYPVITGDGQVNFTIVLAEGYTLSGVTATAGTYKNIKGPADTSVDNTYRITKISADTTITVTTEKISSPELILPEDSEIYIDETRGYIYGISAGMRIDDFEAMFSVSQDGYVEVAATGRYIGTGSLLIVHDSHGEVIAEYTVIIFGDLDGNGRVTAPDISIAQQGLVDGFEDEIFEFAANIVKLSKRDRFNALDVSALYSALVDEPINQAEIAQIYAENEW